MAWFSSPKKPHKNPGPKKPNPPAVPRTQLPPYTTEAPPSGTQPPPYTTRSPPRLADSSIPSTKIEEPDTANKKAENKKTEGAASSSQTLPYGTRFPSKVDDSSTCPAKNKKPGTVNRKTENKKVEETGPTSQTLYRALPSILDDNSICSAKNEKPSIVKRTPEIKKTKGAESSSQASFSPRLPSKLDGSSLLPKFSNFNAITIQPPDIGTGPATLADLESNRRRAATDNTLVGNTLRSLYEREIKRRKEAEEKANDESEAKAKEQADRRGMAALREERLQRFHEVKLQREAQPVNNHASVLKTPHDRDMASRQTRIETMGRTEREEQERWAQTQLEMNAGNCLMGFAWNRVEGGYRCRGGTHLVSDELLAEGACGFYQLDKPYALLKREENWLGPLYSEQERAELLLRLQAYYEPILRRLGMEAGMGAGRGMGGAPHGAPFGTPHGSASNPFGRFQ